MKLRLSHKFSLIMIGTVMLSAALSAFFISRTTRNIFLELVRENDIRTAVILSENIASYYSRTESWDEVRRLLEDMRLPAPVQRMPGMMRGMGQTMPKAFQRQGTNSAQPPLRFLLADGEGRIILDTMETDLPERISPSLLDSGAPIQISGEVLGYVFVQSMVEPVLGPFQRSFLLRVYRAVFLSLLIVAVLAPFVGILLMRHITRPLQHLTEASAQVAGGNYMVFDGYPSGIHRRSDEIGDLSRSFQYMTGEIKAADEWKRALIADSAHELRTPVSLLMGTLEMMMEGMYPPDMEHLKMLHDETAVLENLVGEMQDLANAEAGVKTYSFKPVDLGDLLREVVKQMEPAARKMNQLLDLRIPDEAYMVQLDQPRMKQVFSNILQNALRYTREGGTIRIEVQKTGRKNILCSVEDDGTGIPRDERDKVFKRFYRVQQDRNRKTGGSGLGLSIAREIVLRHDGNIRAEEPLELGGARFVIELPMKPDKRG